MAYVGQPVPTTVYHRTGGKVSDGQSVRVPYTNSGSSAVTLEAGTFVVAGGFHGVVAKTVEVAPGATEDVSLLIEQAEYRVPVYLTAGDGLAIGDLIYWDDAAKRLTKDGASGSNRLVAKATDAVAVPTSDGLVWADVLLLPQV